MAKYYLLENGNITQSADFKFSENCLETQEEIVRDKLSGQLYLQSDYNNLIATDDYKAKVTAQENLLKKAELQAQIDALDSKSIRALREGGIKDEATGQTWLVYYTEQIQSLRAQIASL